LPSVFDRALLEVRRSLTIGLVVAAASCGADGESSIVVATTTSVEDSGLMDALVPAFEAAHPGVSVRTLAVGSGEAFALGRSKDADVLLTHSGWDEAQFVMQGHGAQSTTIMYNHFVIVGPEPDPASVRQATDAPDALKRIASAEAPFLTRGDSSGTHMKEMLLWREAQFAPSADAHAWYVESGVGMGDLLRVAGERGAYTLTDRATFLTAGAGSGLVVLFDDEGDLLYNPYRATLVAGARNAEAAGLFYDWLRGADGQNVIGAFGREQYQRSLFVPAARS
jgi:tungstate transport system substrate-binding protein